MRHLRLFRQAPLDMGAVLQLQAVATPLCFQIKGASVKLLDKVNYIVD